MTKRTNFLTGLTTAAVLAAVDLHASGRLMAQELIPLRSTWRYMDDGVERYTVSPPFYAPAYVDSAWKTGIARLGYGGDGESTTVLFGGSTANKHITTWFRREFTWDGTTPLDADTLLLEFARDDGAMIYLNGTLVERSNMPAGSVSGTTRAAAGVNDNDEIGLIQKFLDPSLLQPGRNVLASAVHQSAPDSSDLGFDLRVALTRRDLLFRQAALGPRGVDIFLGMTDLTGDGAPDLLTAPGSATTVLQLRINDGSGGFGAPQTVDPSFWVPNTMMPMRLNADTRPDLLVGTLGTTSNEEIRTYRNDGNGTLTRTASINGGYLNAVKAADLNGDGLDDIADIGFVSGSQYVRWRRNAGNGTFSAPVNLHTLTTGTGTSKLAVMDANGDGRMDLLVSSATASAVRLLTNQGGTNPAFAVTTVSSLTNAAALAAADLDLDGDTDFIGVNRPATDATSPGQVHTFLNNGTGIFTRQPVPLPATDGLISPVFHDMDRDGDQDMVFVEFQRGTVVIQENDGRGNWVFRRAHDSPLFTSKSSEFAPGDVDGDGEPDVVYADGSSFGNLSWYRNLRGAPPRINTFTANPSTLTSAGQVTLAWDVENAAEITVTPGVTLTPGATSVTLNVERESVFTLTARNRSGQVQSSVTVYLNDVRWSPLINGPGLTSRYYGGAQLDVNQDGLLDVAYAGFTTGAGRAGTYWAPMTASRTFGTALPVLEGAVVYSPQAADINKDGRLDLVTGVESTGLRWFPVSAGGGFAAARVVMNASLSNKLQFFALADFDADGDADAATIQQEQVARIWLNDGSGVFTAASSTPALPPGFRTDGLLAEDTDGDGKADLIFLQDSGSTYIGRNLGGGSFSNVVTVAAEGLDIRYVHFADVTGDGIKDMLSIQSSPGGSSGDIFGTELYLEKGQGDGLNGTRGGFRIAGSLNLPAFAGIATGDLDKDGDLDLLAARRGTPALQYALNDGSGAFSQFVNVTGQTIGTDGAYRILSGDIEGDGDPDVVSFFGPSVGAVFNDGPPPPVVQFPLAAAVHEGGAPVSVQMTVSGLKRPQQFLMMRHAMSSAAAAELIPGPPEVVTAVPGERGKWTFTLQPGVSTVSLTFASPDDIPAEAPEQFTLEFSSLDPVNFSQGHALTLTIPANDYAVTGQQESGEGSLAQALANAAVPALIAERSGAAAEIMFSESNGVPFFSRPVTVSLRAPAAVSYPVILRSPPSPGRIALLLDSADAGLAFAGGPAGMESLLENLDILRSHPGDSAAAAVTLSSEARVRMEHSNVRNNAGTGVAAGDSTLFMRSCTLQDCSHSALRKNGTGTATLVQCTLSGNSTASGGAGVALQRGTVSLINCTVTNNSATGPAGGAGGLAILPGGGSPQMMRLQNTIVAGNSSDVSGQFVSLGGNVIGIADDSTGFEADRTGTAAAPLDAMLGPLAFLGGVTRVHPLLSFTRQRRSPAINAGVESVLTQEDFGPPPWLDQRGAPRRFPVDGALDAGAFEIQNTPPYLSGHGILSRAVLEDAAPFELKPADNMDDAEEGAAGLVFTVTENTSPALLIPSLSGSGADAVLSVGFARNLTGTGFLTVTGTDRYGETVTSRFAVTVEPAVDPQVTARVLVSPVIGGEGPRDIFEFSVVNRGPSDASALTLQATLQLPVHTALASGTVTRGVFDAATGLWTLDLPEGGRALLTLALESTREAPGGSDSVTAELAVVTTVPSTTGDAADNSARSAVSLVSPQNLAIDGTGDPVPDRQSGLSVQRMTFTNNNPLPLAFLRIHVGGLTGDWRLWNAAGSDTAGAYVDVPGPLASGASVAVNFEYYSPTRAGQPAPQYEAAILRASPAVNPPAGSPFEISRILPLTDGEVLLEWPSTPGREYEVQYSRDLLEWRAAIPRVTASSTRTQWIDHGLPKTVWSLLSPGPRYYRVAETGDGGRSER